MELPSFPTPHGYDPKVFIPRKEIEEAHNIKMPLFYHSSVHEQLHRIKSALAEPQKALSAPSYKEKSQNWSFFPAIGDIFHMGGGLFNRQEINIFSNNTTVVQKPTEKETATQTAERKAKEEEERKRKQEMVLGGISAIVFFVASYFAGQSTAEATNLNYVRNDMALLGTLSADTYKQQLALTNSQEFTIGVLQAEILDEQIKLMGTISLNAVVPRLQHYAATAFKIQAFLAGSAFFTAISSFALKSRQLTILGGFSMLAGFGFGFYQYGQKDGDKRLVSDKAALIKEIDVALTIFDNLPKTAVGSPVHYNKAQRDGYFAPQNFAYWANASAPPEF